MQQFLAELGLRGNEPPQIVRLDDQRFEVFPRSPLRPTRVRLTSL